MLLIAAANQVALVLLLEALTVDKVSHGASLLIAALQVWLTNIIIFGLAFWEMDRGGAVARTQQSRAELAAADFRFPQDEDADAVREVRMRSSEKSDWVPSFLDYLYVSVTNSTAFSPTDTMPLSPRAKILMGVQAIAAVMVNVLVIARGVSLLQ